MSLFSKGVLVMIWISMGIWEIPIVIVFQGCFSHDMDFDVPDCISSRPSGCFTVLCLAFLDLPGIWEDRSRRPGSSHSRGLGGIP